MEEAVRYDNLPEREHAPKTVLMEEFDAHVNRSAKDSIFCDLFSRPEYCLQLYQALHPEDRDVKAENITLVTLSSLMMQPVQRPGYSCPEPASGAGGSAVNLY